MSKLELHFAGAEDPELFRVVYFPANGSEAIVSVRGKTAGAYGAGQSFQWTQAVKAFCILAAESAVDAKFILEGSYGSPASTLDYALAKETLWLTEMFGCDASGKPRLRKLFRRTNADRRFSGPVGVSLNPAAWNNCAISIAVDGRVLNDLSELRQFAQSLTDGCQRSARPPRSRDAVQPPAQLSSDFNRQNLMDNTALRRTITKMVEDEFALALRRVDIFAPKKADAALAAINRAGFFRKVSGRDLELAGFQGRHILPEQRLGIVRDDAARQKALFDCGPLSVLAPSTLLGPLILFYYLQHERADGFRLSYDYPHAVGVIRNIINGNFNRLPDILCCGLAPAATLMGSKYRKYYVPLMLLPDSSQKIVAPRSDKLESAANAYDNAVYSYLRDDPSIPGFLLEELETMGVLRKRKMKTVHHEPEESFALLAQGDPETRAAVFFPHGELNCLFNNCVTLPDPRATPNSQEVVLFVHRSKADRTGFLSALELTVRDAWLDLRMDRTILPQLVNRLTSPEEQYMKCITRFSGLYAAAL